MSIFYSTIFSISKSTTLDAKVEVGPLLSTDQASNSPGRLATKQQGGSLGAPLFDHFWGRC